MHMLAWTFAARIGDKYKIRLTRPITCCGSSLESPRQGDSSARQNQQNGMCAQRKLKSAWASAQSDQSLRCPPEESLGP